MCQHPQFSLRVHRWRLVRCLTQPALAAHAGMPTIRVWRMEHDQCNPRLSELLTLACVLDVDVSDLYEVQPCAVCAAAEEPGL